MMAQRKLQQEIDRVFKRVNEGLASFDYLYEKLTTSESQAQKEKLESDLKKEIKKLQRQREQIKSWLGGNDVKDKKPLLEYRRKIERQMERFKLVERDMKTKAFSKEGLSMDKRLDPREREKAEAAEFVSDSIDRLNQQNEVLEGKIQQLQLAVKKNKRQGLTKKAQSDEYQKLIDRNSWHVGRLEAVLRGIENGHLSPEQITDLKELVTYYVESNQDPEFYDDESVYDDLGLDSLALFESSDEEDESRSERHSIEPDTPKKEETKVKVEPKVEKPEGVGSLKPAPKVAEVKYALLVQPKKQQPVTPQVLYLKLVSLISRDELTSANHEQPEPFSGLPCLADLMKPFEANKARTESIIQGQKLPESAVRALHNSLVNCPDSVDLEKPFGYFPLRPHPTSIDYPVFRKSVDSVEAKQDHNFCLVNHYNSKELFTKFGVETLFFIFYYGDDNGSDPNYYQKFSQPEIQRNGNKAGYGAYENGSYIQYLALKELHARGWRFNKRLHVWFQKLTPQEIQELGQKSSSVCKFFDWEADWAIRLKEIELDFESEDFEDFSKV